MSLSGGGSFPTNTDPTALTVGEEQTVRDNNGYIRPATITGHAYNDLNGNGAFNPGEPGIPNTPVGLYNSLNQLVASTFTNGAGVYTFSGIWPPGTYTVREFDQ